MSIFDLLFIAIFLTAAAMLCVAAYHTVRGNGRRALKIVSRLGLGLTAYLGVVIFVSLVSPRRVVPLGEDLCWDDWCLAATDVSRENLDAVVRYRITIRITSRALRRAQRGRGAFVRVMDDQGRFYAPLADPAAVPLDVLIQPGQSVQTLRSFEVPAEAAHPVLVLSHGSGFPGWFIIGDAGSLFHQPTVVPLGAD